MWGIFAILIAFGVFWYMFQQLSNTKSTKQEIQELNKRPEIGTVETTRQLLNATNTGTLQAFVYPLQPQKTGTLVMCSEPGSANPGEPECSTGQYNLCRCVENDCSPCNHAGYLNVLNISNIIKLELLASPDASRQTAAGAQLVVRTVGMEHPFVSNQPDPTRAKVQKTFIETIPLPNIPFQKWTLITIAREGRRFDVYYNGEIVMSKRTQYIVDIRSAFGPVIAGDPNLMGQISNVESHKEKLTQSQVLAFYKANADTTGRPYAAVLGSLKDLIPKCEGGGCLGGPALRPTSPLLDWQTPYA